ncbi:unnamed protein product [Ectocarpus sp. CCAP 1310/34]|nr:unnamed protein product [Ectocarpus sp. CCAP 1310/34]
MATIPPSFVVTVKKNIQPQHIIGIDTTTIYTDRLRLSSLNIVTDYESFHIAGVFHDAGPNLSCMLIFVHNWAFRA